MIVKTDGSFSALLVRLGGGVRDTRTGRALSGSYADTLTTARHCMEPVTAQLARVWCEQCGSREQWFHCVRKIQNITDLGTVAALATAPGPVLEWSREPWPRSGSITGQPPGPHTCPGPASQRCQFYQHIYNPSWPRFWSSSLEQYIGFFLHVGICYRM